jgi:hypothetical protein
MQIMMKFMMKNDMKKAMLLTWLFYIAANRIYKGLNPIIIPLESNS